MKNYSHIMLFLLLIILLPFSSYSEEKIDSSSVSEETPDKFEIVAWKTDLPFRNDGILDAASVRNVIVKKGFQTFVSGRDKGLAIKGENVSYIVYSEDNLTQKETEARKINQEKDYAVCFRVLDMDEKPLKEFHDKLDLLDSKERNLDIACIIRENGDRVFILPKDLDISLLQLKISRKNQDGNIVSFKLAAEAPK